MSFPTSTGPTATSSSRRLSLSGLQALRGLAALLVVADHALDTYGSKVSGGSTVSGNADHAFAWLLGDTGVWIFFLISGFTMVLAHGSDFGRPGAPLQFAHRRLGRIVPLYWLITLLMFVELKVKHVPVLLSGLFLSMCFIPHREPTDIFGRPLYAPGWTLEYEMFFYAVFAACLFLRPARGLIILLGLMSVLAAASSVGLLAHGTIIGFLSQPVIGFFVGGIGLGLLRRRLDPLAGWRWGFSGAVAASASAIGAGLGAAWLIGASSSSMRAICVAAAMVSVAAASLAIEAGRTSVARRLADRLGDATFSIYMTHTFVLGPSGRAAHELAPALPPAAFVLATMIVSILVGLAVFRFIERPLIAIARTILRDRKPGERLPLDLAPLARGRA